MRQVLAILVSLFTAAVVVVLSFSWSTLPALGPLLNPGTGWLMNAEPVHKDFNDEIKIKGLMAPVEIWLEDRLVPHIRAQNDHDLYLAEGYIHAYFRLWQMDLQTRAAGGRVSEVVGPKALDYDRTQRRKGMVYAAENSLKVMEADPRSKAMLDAYTDGINIYIHSLHDNELPLEYKLMGFEPEDWTNLRTALLMKYMADDLTGASDDIAMTRLRDELSPEEFNYLYPEKIKGSKPVIPEGTRFDPPSLKIPSVPGIPDSLFAHFTNGGNVSTYQPINLLTESGLGSNNWAISGTHTASGAPILCNDPHLGLNLPSLWFEIQLTAPGINTYGVSLPGAPGVVIGFNDSISWGFTNNYRDVKDFYEIYPADENDYWFNGVKTAYNKRIERIGVKGETDIVDTVDYTIHGPIFYDRNHPFDSTENGMRSLAMCWMAHRGTNELLSLYLLNRAQNYGQFVQAIQPFDCPAQNFVYADRQNNIAMWGQGQFINKWKEQGRFVMEGRDSLTLWGEDIPKMENPHVLNPPQGYVASANQSVTDSTYPYYYNGTFFEFRSWSINGNIRPFKKEDLPFGYERFTTPKEMMALQNDVLSVLQFSIGGIFDKFEDSTAISQLYNQLLSGIWSINKDSSKTTDSYYLGYGSETATLYQLWWYFLYKNIWQDEFKNNLWPSAERTMQILLKDSTSKYYDDIRTPQKETLRDIVQRSFKETEDSLKVLKRTTGLEWYKVKNTTLLHLAKIPAFSYYQLKTGGWGNTINAMKEHHGPSWRMIVQMGKDSIEAYGVYPGGQSGNPGSIHYGDNIDKWVEGKYWRLLFIPAETKQKPKEIKFTIALKPSN